MIDDGSVSGGTGSGSGAPERLVTRARRSAIWGLSLLAWSTVVVGLLGATLFLAVMWLFTTAFVASRSLLDILANDLWIVFVVLFLVVSIGLALNAIMIGILYFLDAWRLERVRLVIDPWGITRVDRRRSGAAWERIRHVAVTSGNPPYRRLLVDTGAMPESWWFMDKIRPGRAHLRLLRPRRQFEINMPIDRFDASVDEILGAIYDYSGGRFPDRGMLLPPPGW